MQEQVFILDDRRVKVTTYVSSDLVCVFDWLTNAYLGLFQKSMLKVVE